MALSPGSAVVKGLPSGIAGPELHFERSDFEIIARVIRERVGISLKDGKETFVFSRMAKRLRELGIASFKEYIQRLDGHNGDEELGVMIDLLTTNTTKFFRESHHFEHLKRDVLEPLVEQARLGKRPRKIRIWTGACSRGHEPYSIAATLDPVIAPYLPFDAKILATDVDTTALTIARAGSYSRDEVEDAPLAYRQQMFDMTTPKDRYVIQPAMRALVVFKQLNLIGSWPMQGPFDAIFLRNVAIYFDHETQVRLFDRIATLMAPHALLFIGHSESLSGVTTRLVPAGRTSYRLANGRPLTSERGGT